MSDPWAFSLVCTLALWGLTKAALAGIAFRRLRLTAAGVVLGGSLAVSALKSFARLAQHFLLADVSPLDPTAVAIYVVSSTISLVSLAGIAGGILLIPSSLRRLTMLESPATGRVAAPPTTAGPS
jgi:hypothetical protein